MEPSPVRVIKPPVPAVCVLTNSLQKAIFIVVCEDTNNGRKYLSLLYPIFGYKMSLKFKVTFLIIIGTIMILFANNVYSQSKIDCSKAATQPEIDACSLKEYNTADKELNDLYKKVTAKLNAQQKLVLLQSQRKWISFRDEYSKIYGLVYEGGTVAPSAVLKSKTDITRARTQDLKFLLGQVDL